MYFIANFQHLMDQENKNESERRYGNFSMMVTAADMNDALAKFRSRLESFRRSTSLFSGKCVIYLQQVMEFDRIPNKDAVLLNYRSFAGDPLMPFISCVVPTEQSNACNIHEWENGLPVTEGREDNLFIAFDPE